jgi:hypothetical protein
VLAISWTPHGKALFFRAAEPRTAAELAKERARDDVYAYDENYKHTHLWKVAVESGTAMRVTNGDFSVIAYQLSEDGTKIVYQRAPSPLLADVARGDVWVANADGSAAAPLHKIERALERSHNCSTESRRRIESFMFSASLRLCVVSSTRRPDLAL